MSLPIGSLQHKVCTETRCFGINYCHLLSLYICIRIDLSKVFFKHMHTHLANPYLSSSSPLNLLSFVLRWKLPSPSVTVEIRVWPFRLWTKYLGMTSNLKTAHAGCTARARMKGNDVSVLGSDAWEKSRNHRLTNHETRCCYDHLLGELLLFLHDLPGGLEMMVYNPPFFLWCLRGDIHRKPPINHWKGVSSSHPTRKKLAVFLLGPR